MVIGREATGTEEQDIAAVGKLRDTGCLNEGTVVIRAVKNLVGFPELVDAIACNLLLHDGRWTERWCYIAAATLT